MFAAPSSTVKSLSSSPTSTTSPNHSQHNNKIVVSSKDEFECEKGYTIYVPANVRFRGMNMHLDLKIDEKTLSAASSEIAKSKLSAPVENDESGSPPGQAQTHWSKDPAVLGISCSYSIADKSTSSNTDNSKQLPSVSSTTTEQLERPRFADVDEVSSPGDDVLQSVTSTISTAQEDAEAVVDTTTATTSDDCVGHSVSYVSASPQRKVSGANDGPLAAIDKFADRCETSSFYRSDCCLPSSSSELLAGDDEQNDCENVKIPDDDDKDDDSVVHDSRPCSSANFSVAAADPISSSGQDSGAAPAKRRRIATPNFCGFVDADRGQCKQRAILSYKYCIRHILLDSSAPYRQCQHKRKPKNKKGDFLQCTNAIRTDKTDIFCSTHLIMKGMLQPKTKKSCASLSTNVDSASPSTIAASPPPSTANKSADFAASDDGVNTSSFDYSHYGGGDILSHSRTGCESTSSWEQMSNMSGSITPGRSGLYLQQPASVQPTDGIVIAQTPPPGHFHSQQQPMTMLGATPHQNSMTAAASTSAETAVEAPNLDTNMSAGGAYLAQHTSQQYAGNVPQQFSSEPFSGGPMSAYEAQIQQHQNSSPAAFHSNGQMAKMPDGTFNAAGMQPQMSRLSKQHPQLAAKLLQTSYPHSSAVYYTPTAGDGSAGTATMISPDKHTPAYMNVNVKPIVSATAGPPPPKRTRPEMAGQPVILPSGDGSDGVTIYSPYGHQPQMAFPLPQGATGRMAPTPTDERVRQVLRYNEMQSQQQRFAFPAYPRPPNMPPNRLSDHQNQQPLPSCVPQQISSQQLSKILSRPAYIQYQTRLMDVMSAHCVDISSFVDAEPKLVKYRIADDIDDLGVDEEARICRDYLNASTSMSSTGSQRRRTPKSSISLRQKRHKVRLTGAFRNVPLVDSMCKIIEHHDFDSTDLFPLGLEPSDDESSSDEGFPVFDRYWPSESADRSRNRIDLYLLKKKLRLESSRLVQGAKIAMPIIEAAKVYKNCVGAALRTRQMNRRRESIIGVEKQRYRPCQFERTDPEKARTAGGCRRICLPASNYCADHVLYGVEQKLFTYCKRVCCGRPVLCADALLLDGMCRQHYDDSVAPPSKKEAHIEIKQESLPTDYERKSEYAPTSNGYYKSYQNASKFFNDGVDPSNDDIVEDVSLASVAKDLGLNGHELTDMLERLPVDDTLNDQDIGDDDGEGLLASIKAGVEVSGIMLGHSWADVEQFLLSEGYCDVENEHSEPSPAGGDSSRS